MANARRGRPQARSPGKPSVLDRLRAEEAAIVLARLLSAHRALRSDAKQIARSLLGEVSFDVVADAVEQAVSGVDLETFAGRAGRHFRGYTSPAEAAWQLLEEAVAPFFKDMKRRIELGHESEALEICTGLVLGLYRLRDEDGVDVLQCASEFCVEAATRAVETWRRSRRPKGAPRRSRSLPGDFVDGFIPDWADGVGQL